MYKTLLKATLPTLLIVLISGLHIIEAQDDSHVTITYSWSGTSHETLSDVSLEFVADLQLHLTNYNVELDPIIVSEDFETNDSVMNLNFTDVYDNEQVFIGYVISFDVLSHPMQSISTILESNQSTAVHLSETHSTELIGAYILYASRQFEDAQTLLGIAEDTPLQRGFINFIQGNLSLLDGNIENAISHYEQDIWSNIGNFYGVNLAWAYFQNGQIAESFELLDEAIDTSIILQETEPSYLLSVRSRLHALNFGYDSAIVDIDNAIELAEKNEVSARELAELYTIRAEIIFLIYEWDRVEDDLTTAIELDPTYAPAYFQRGVLFYTMTRRDDALSDFEMYLELARDGIYAEQALEYSESITIELEALGG